MSATSLSPSTIKVFVNTDQSKTASKIVMKQGSKETIYLEIIINDKGGVMEFPPGTTGRIKMRKCDTVQVDNPVYEVKTNSVIVKVTEQMQTSAGDGECEIVLTSLTQVLPSATFTITILPSVHDGSTVESLPEYKTFENALVRVEVAVPKAEQAYEIAMEAQTLTDVLQQKLDNGEFIGAQGIQGIQGEKGDKGETGAAGLQGIQGIQGEDGLQGIQGIQGEKGSQGDTGAGLNILGNLADISLLPTTGTTGDAYLIVGDLFVWSDGSFINAGNIQGPQGPQGFQGETGQQGSQGNKGIQGIQGIQGEQGENGLSAYQVWLSIGNTGTEAEYIASLKGIQGIQGEQGEPGSTNGDTSASTVSFTAAASDTDIETGDTHATLFGKILKRFNSIATALGLKQTIANMVQTDTVNDSTKYPSSAVTYALGVEIETLNNNLVWKTIVDGVSATGDVAVPSLSNYNEVHLMIATTEGNPCGSAIVPMSFLRSGGTVYTEFNARANLGALRYVNNTTISITSITACKVYLFAR